MKGSNFNRVIALALTALLALSLPAAAQTRQRKTAKPAAQAPSNSPADQEKVIKQGLAAFEGAHYEDAIKIFHQFIASYPKSDFSDLSYTYAIRSLIKLERFPEATELLDKFKAAIPDSPLVASLGKEIQGAKLVMAATAPALEVGLDGANPFAAETKDVPAVEMPRIVDNRVVGLTSGNVPPPTTLSRSNGAPRSQGRPADQSVPPPTGLKNPKQDDLTSSKNANGRKQPNQASNSGIPRLRDGQSSQGAAAAPALPPEATSSNSKPAQQNQMPAGAGQTNSGSSTAKSGGSGAIFGPGSDVPPPTTLADKTNPNQPSNRARVVDAKTPTTEAVAAGSGMAPIQLALPRTSVQTEAGKVTTFPMLIRNAGTRDDAYKLSTSLPASVETIFVLDDNRDGRVQANELSVEMTPTLPPSGVASIILVVRVPQSVSGRLDFKIFASPVIDQRGPVQADVSIVTPVGKPNVTVDVDFDRYKVRRGHSFPYTIKINNASDLPAKMVRLNYSFEEGYKFEGSKPEVRTFADDIRTATWDFAEIAPHSTVTVEMHISVMRAAEAGPGVIGYGTLHAAAIAPIQIGGAPVTVEEKIAGANVEVAAVFRELKGAPKEVVYIPFIIRNVGDHKDSFDVKVEPFGGIIFADTNRDGVYQSGEPTITRTADIPAGGDYQVLVRAEVPSQLGGSQQFPYRLVASSVLDKKVTATGVSYVTLSIPRVTINRVQSAVQSGGGIAYYELTVTNDGQGEAKNILIREFLVPGNQFLNSSVAPVVSGSTRGEGQKLEWKIDSLMPGASRTYRVSVKRGGNADNPERATVTFFDASGTQYAGQ